MVNDSQRDAARESARNLYSQRDFQLLAWASVNVSPNHPVLLKVSHPDWHRGYTFRSDGALWCDLEFPDSLNSISIRPADPAYLAVVGRIKEASKTQPEIADYLIRHSVP